MRSWAPIVGLLAAGCAGPAWKRAPHDRYHQATPPPILHTAPSPRTRSEWWDSISNSTTRPLGQVLSPGHHLTRALGAAPALDVNTFGQVLDSTWFQNRIGRGGFTPEEARRGANTLGGPAPGRLTVIGGKTEGATPGLVLRDAEGHRFIAKFDPPAFPELASGAEIIGSRVLYAAGYNVPENYLVDLETAALDLAEDARTAGEYGTSIPLDAAGLDAILCHANPFSDGRTRVMLSRIIPGLAVGSSEYRGVFPDDPNDRVPHERRRSLRGLWMFQAWLHNSDTTALNTLDTFVEAGDPAGPGQGYIVHNLIDFGDALGAGGTKPKYPGQGYEGDLDWVMIGQRTFSLGIVYPYWLPARRAPYRAVGIFEAEVFEPSRWRSEVPNPAFDVADPLDEYWAASIIARYTPDHLAAIVAAAEYSEPGAAEWVLRVLSERQYELLERAFARVLPLEQPVVRGEARLELTDLAVEVATMIAPEDARYPFEVSWNRTGASDPVLARGEVTTPAIELRGALEEVRARAGAAFEEDPFLTVRWWRAGTEGPEVHVHLRAVGRRLLPVALDRTVD